MWDTKILFYVFVSVEVVFTRVSVKKSKDNLPELALPFYYVHPEDGAQVTGLDCHVSLLSEPTHSIL